VAEIVGYGHSLVYGHPLVKLAADTLLACLILLIVSACGRRLLESLGFGGLTAVESWAFGALTGLVGLAYGTLAISYLGWLNRPCYLALFAALAAYGWPTLRSLRLRGFSVPLWVGLLAFPALCNLLFNHMPPQDLDGYQLTVPALFARAGAAVDRPDNFCTYYPLTGNMIFLVGMVLRGAGLAQIWSWVFGLLAAAGVYCLALRLFDARTARVAATLYYLFPITSNLAGSAYPDQFLAFGGTLALCAVHIWLHRRRPEARWLLLAGFCLGAGTSARYTGAVVSAAMASWVLYRMAVDPKQRWRCFAQLVGAGVAAAVVVAPWWIRNLYHTGNPLYPRPLLGLPSDEFFRIWYTTTFTQPWWGILQQLPRRFSLEGTTLNWGPLPVAFLPSLLLWRPMPPGLALTGLAFATTLCASCALFPPTPRYYLFTICLASVLTAHALLELWRRTEGASRKLLIGLLATAAVLPYLGFPFYFAAKRLPYQLGWRSMEAYLASRDDAEGYGVRRYVNENVAPGNTIFILGVGFGPQLYYPDHKVIGTYAYSVAFLNSGLGQALAGLRRERVSHIVTIDDMFNEDWRYVADMLASSVPVPVQVRWMPEGIRGGVFELERTFPQRRLWRIRYDRFPGASPRTLRRQRDSRSRSSSEA